MAQIYFIPSISKKPLIEAPIDGKNINDVMEELFSDYAVIERGQRFAFFTDSGALMYGVHLCNSIALKCRDAQSADWDEVINYIRGIFTYEDDYEFSKNVVRFSFANNNKTTLIVQFYWEIELEDCAEEDLKSAIVNDHIINQKQLQLCLLKNKRKNSLHQSKKA